MNSRIKCFFICFIVFLCNERIFSQLNIENYYISLGTSVLSTRSYAGKSTSSFSTSKSGFPVEFYFEVPVASKISLGLMVGYVSDEYKIDLSGITDDIKFNVESYMYGVRGAYYLKPKKIFNPYIGIMIGAITSKGDAIANSGIGTISQSAQNTETKFVAFLGAKLIFSPDFYLFTEIASSISIIHIGAGISF